MAISKEQLKAQLATLKPADFDQFSDAELSQIESVLSQPDAQQPITNELILSGDIPDLPGQGAPVGSRPTQEPLMHTLANTPFFRGLSDVQDALGVGTTRGALNLVGGAGQLAAGGLEAAGLVPQGQPARVTEAIQGLKERFAPLRDIPEALSPLLQGAQTMTEASPFLSVPLASTPAKLVAQSGGLGALSGGASFIENPEEAGLSLERGGRAVLGGGAGIVLSATGSAIGGVRQALGRGDVPRQLTTRIEESGPRSITRKEAALAKESLGAGIPTTPSAAAGSKVIAGKETRVIPTESRQFKAESALDRGRRGAQNLVDDFLDSVLPERQAPAPIKTQVGQAYEKAAGDLFDTTMLESRLRQDKTQATFGALLKQFDKSLKSNPVLKARIQEHPQNSIARLDALKRFIDAEQAKIDKSPSFKRLGQESVNSVRRALIEVGDSSSPAYETARNLAHRSKIVENIDKRLSAKAVSDDSPVSSLDVSPVDFFKSVMRNKKQMEDLFKDLRSIKNPQIRAQAVGKARKLRRVLSRWERTEPVLEKLSKGDPRTVQERSQVIQTAIFTTKRLLERGKSDAMVDFLTSDRWADDVLDGAIKAKSPVQFAGELGNFLTQIGVRAPGPAQDIEGTLGFSQPEQ